MSAIGLNRVQRSRARSRMKAAAYEMLKNSSVMQYSQGPQRFSGITNRRRAYKGQVPLISDCSSSSTWCAWDATRRYKLGDFVNGLGWGAGYTGTMQNHGARVKGRKLAGDLVFYGNQGGGVAEHVAVYVGRGLVVSHGSPGAHLLRWDYRGVNEVRRYIR